MPLEHAMYGLLVPETQYSLAHDEAAVRPDCFPGWESTTPAAGNPLAMHLLHVPGVGGPPR